MDEFIVYKVGHDTHDKIGQNWEKLAPNFCNEIMEEFDVGGLNFM
jgi:hypothetical protein